MNPRLVELANELAKLHAEIAARKARILEIRAEVIAMSDPVTGEVKS